MHHYCIIIASSSQESVARPQGRTSADAELQKRGAVIRNESPLQRNVAAANSTLQGIVATANRRYRASALQQLRAEAQSTGVRSSRGTEMRPFLSRLLSFPSRLLQLPPSWPAFSVATVSFPVALTIAENVPSSFRSKFIGSSNLIMDPESRTRTRSASMILSIRCAMVRTVQFEMDSFPRSTNQS